MATRALGAPTYGCSWYMGFNPFTKSFWNDVGDRVAGTFTLGHCDHSGCSSGDRAQEQAQAQQQQLIADLQKQMQQLIYIGLLGVGGVVAIEVLFKVFDLFIWIFGLIF